MRSWLLVAGALALAACSSSSTDDTGAVPPDSGVEMTDALVQGPDGTTGTPDAGPPGDDAAIGGDDAAVIEIDAGDVDGGLQLGVAPARRGDMAFAIDPVTERVIMVFGDKAEPVMCSPAASQFLSDAYSFDPATNRWAAIDLMGSMGPTQRARASAVWDPLRRRFVLFGGRFRATGAGPYTYLKDVWALDPSTGLWTQLSAQSSTSAPSGRMNTAVVVSPDDDALIVHGGGALSANGTSFTPDNQTWLFRFAENSWTRVATAAPPRARLFHVAALDRTRRRLFVFGGGGASAFTGPFYKDMWYLSMDTGTWTQVPEAPTWPSARIKATMEYDGARDRLILFAGHDDGPLGNDNELWTFDLATLTWELVIRGDVFNRNFPGNPPPQCSFPADFANVDLNSPERRESHLFTIHGDKAIMYGGRSDCGLVNDTWILDSTTMTWSRVNGSMNGMTCFRSGRTDCTDPNAQKCG